MKTKSIFASLLAASVAVGAMGITAFAGDSIIGGGESISGGDTVCEINGLEYDTLAEAVSDVADGGTITLTGDTEEGGIIVDGTKDFTIDFGGHTYTVVNPTVGSPGTTTNAMQLLKGASLTFKNGTIEAGTGSAKILIQKYCDLTLEDMNLVGAAETQYVLSNNNGTTLVKGDTNITAAEGQFAFDAYYWPKNTYPSVNVIFDETMTGTVTGAIEFADDGTDAEGAADPAKHSITIMGGTFTADPSAYVADGYEATFANGVYTVAEEVVSGGAVTTPEDFIAAVAAGGTVELGADINVGSTIIEVTEDVVINGNGYTVTSNATRILWVDAPDVTLEINDIDFVGGSATQRGLQVNGDMTDVTLIFDNISVSGLSYYAINLCNNSTVTLTATDSTFTGWSAYNAWTLGHVATFENCTLNGVNDKKYNADGWNDFATIVLEGDTTGATDTHSAGNTVNLIDCTVTATSTKGNRQYAIGFNNPCVNNVVNVSGSETEMTYADGNFYYDYGTDNHLNVTAGTYSSDIIDAIAEGYSEIDNGDDTYTVQTTTTIPVVPGTYKSVEEPETPGEEPSTYKQTTVDEAQFTADTKVTYTVTISRPGEEPIQKSKTFENYMAASGDVVFGLVITGIPTDVSVVITSSLS